MNWNKKTQEEIGILLGVSLYPASLVMKDVCLAFVNKKRSLIQKGAVAAHYSVFTMDPNKPENVDYDTIHAQLLTDVIGWFFPTPLKGGISEEGRKKLSSVLKQFLLKVYNHVIYDKVKGNTNNLVKSK